jgi:hypothetical protein
MPIQDAWQAQMVQQGQEHHKIIHSFRCHAHMFFHAPQYPGYFNFCLFL